MEKLKKMDESTQVKRHFSFSQYPNEVRKRKSDLSPMSKLAMVIIIYEMKSSKIKDFSPSYSYMNKYYGFKTKTWKKSLEELVSLGYITIETISVQPRKTKIVLNNNVVSGYKYSMFPNSILLTDVFTNTQKILIGTIIGEFTSDFRSNPVIRAISIYNIVEKLNGVCFKKSTIFQTIKDLSDPNSGFINIFGKKDDLYFLDISALIAISDRIHTHTFTQTKIGKWERSTYSDPVKGQFMYCNETQSIIEDRSVIVEKPKKEYVPYDCDAEQARMDDEYRQKAIEYADTVSQVEEMMRKL